MKAYLLHAVEFGGRHLVPGVVDITSAEYHALSAITSIRPATTDEAEQAIKQQARAAAPVIETAQQSAPAETATPPAAKPKRTR